MSFELQIAKENFKFAATHFAIFGPYCGERLHGHNYYVSVNLKATSLDEKLGLAVEFNELKPAIVDACKQLDEYVLIPEKSPYLQINKQDDSVEILFSKKRYVLPAEDVKFLPVLNISCEELSRWLWQQLQGRIQYFERIDSFRVTVQETRGQRASYTESNQ